MTRRARAAWEEDQALVQRRTGVVGSFGKNPPPVVRHKSGQLVWDERYSPQPRWWATVDLDEALRSSEESLWLWRQASPYWHQGSALAQIPVFSGGLMDSWPAWAVDALAICRQESETIQRMLQYETRQKAPEG